MFYKPTFCCNCGEKIERIDSKVWSSRRFCDICAVEYKGIEWIATGAVVVASLFVLFGIGTYFQNRGENAHKSDSQIVEKSIAKRKMVAEQNILPLRSDRNSNSRSTFDGSSTTPLIAKSTPEMSGEQLKIEKAITDNSAHYCGAMTKKGSSCLRKVKTNVRCWQHSGQPSVMLSRKILDAL